MSLAPIIFDKPFNPPSGFVVEARILECLFALVTRKLDACEEAEGL
jgi:hypothetical protein